MKFSPPLPHTLLHSRWLLPAALAVALAAGGLAGQVGTTAPGLLLLLGPLGLGLLVLIFRQPRAGVVAYIVYCFALGFTGRHFITEVPMGLGMDALLVLTWVAAVFQPPGRLQWARLRTDLGGLALAWFGYNLLELGNPAGPSPLGWVYEMRSTALYWLLAVPLGGLVFHRLRDLRLFLGLVIGISVLGALYGMKQKFLGLDAMEQLWLDSGQASTHLIWGKLRVFSFYSEAAQFGASQAHVGLICLILALGPFAWWQKLLFAAAALLLFYGMLISGTRGALFVVVAGLFVYLLLSKQPRVLVLGLVLAGSAFGVLKYTGIGNSSADVRRLRTSLDPTDPSFQARMRNQATLRAHLATKPFGEGVGTIGIWGQTFNADKFISTIPPDSFFVKVWAEYGIVGLIVWLGMMLYILGKCGGIVWRIRDPQLRQQLLALTAGYGGILVCSYGNEVMNQIPSGMIIYFSWVFIFAGPELDKALEAAPARA